MKRKDFLANPKHQYRVSRYGEHDCNEIIKRMEIVMGIQVCLILWMDFDYQKNSGKKAFLANPKHQFMHPNVENMIVMPIKKRMETIMSIQVCLISRTNFDYKENGEKKAFLANTKQQYRVS